MDLLERVQSALADRYGSSASSGAAGWPRSISREDLKHERQVAVKVLRPELAPALGPERFLREIRIAAGLQHPHILPLLRLGRGGRAALLRDAVRGGRVAARPAAARAALAVGRGAADRAGRWRTRWTTRTRRASSTATSSRRTSCCSGGHALVADFGIARAVEPRAARADRDRAGDRHAGLHEPRAGVGDGDAGRAKRRVRAGLCAVRDAGGRAAVHRAARRRRSWRGKRSNQCPVSGRCARRCRRRLEAAITRALAKAPADRFATAGEFKEALTRALREPAVIRPASGGRRLAVGVAALMVAAAVAGGLLGGASAVAGP